MPNSIVARALPLSIVVVTACVDGRAAPAERSTDTAAASMLVSVDWLASRVGDPEVVILHVLGRGVDAEEYRRGHIPGARPLAYASITVDDDDNLPPVGRLEEVMRSVGVSNDSRVVLYGSDAISTARAWVTLDYLGFGEHASVLDGGLAAWKGAGQQLVTDTPRYPRGTFTARAQPHRIVDGEWVRSRLDAKGIAFVDTRSEEEYNSTGDGMHAAGHLPGAQLLLWRTLLESRENPTLRDSAELRRLFEAAGAARGDTVVTYCMVGYRASLSYFVARMLGYETRLYDGSWHDWSERR
jgi:thiosulfate/3-mercaptopyruvate sulfurtransferase